MKVSKIKLSLFIVITFVALLLVELLSFTNITDAAEPQYIDNSELPSLATTETKDENAFEIARINRTFNHFHTEGKGPGKFGDYDKYDWTTTSGGVAPVPWSKRQNSGHTDWGTYKEGSTTYKIKAPVSCLAYQYASNELQTNKDNMKGPDGDDDVNKGQPKDSNNKPFISIKTTAAAHSDQGTGQTGSDSSYYIMIHNSQMPGTKSGNKITYKFPKYDDTSKSPLLLDKKDSSDPSKGIGQLLFKDAGKVQGKWVDAKFTIDRLRVVSENDYEYAKAHDAAHDAAIELPFMSVNSNRLKNLVHEKVEKYESGLVDVKGYDCLDLQTSAGSISLTSDNAFWAKGDSNVKLMVEIDYTIGIYEHNSNEAVNFPVYTFYTDLDVQSHANVNYGESVSPITAELDPKTGKKVEKKNKLLDYMMAFEKLKINGEEHCYVDAYTKASEKYQREDDGVEVSATIRANEHCGVVADRARSSYYPDTLVNTGCILLTDPRNQGEYSARWRGERCGTGVSLAPYTMFELTKSIDGKNIKQNVSSSEILKDENKYKFNLDFPMGKYNETIFSPYASVAIKDSLPLGVEPVMKAGSTTEPDCNMYLVSEDGQSQQLLTAGTDYKVVMEQKSGEGKTITATMTSSFMTNTKSYNGGKLRLVVNAYSANYQSGGVVEYDQFKDEPGYDVAYKGQKVWQYENKSTVIIEGSELDGNSVNVYTPLYSNNHKFYEYDATKTASDVYTTFEVPEAVTNAALPIVPDTSKYYLKNGDTGKGPDELKKVDGKTVTAVRAPKGDVEGIWLFIEWQKKDGKTVNPICHNADITYNGYWAFVPNPEQKECTLQPGGSVVKLGDPVSYKATGTNEEYGDKAKLVFTDIPSLGLTFKENTVVKKQLMGSEDEMVVDAKDIELVNKLKENKGDGESTLVWSIHNVEYGAKIHIYSNFEVNIDAKKTSEVKNQLSINNQIKVVRNPIADKIYDESKTDMIHDGSPVHVGEKIAYLIKWSGYDDKDSNVVITDTLSKGLKVDINNIEVNDATTEPVITIDPDPSTGEGETKITIQINNQTKGVSGTVKYYAEVTEDAIKELPEQPPALYNKYSLSVDDRPVGDVEPLINPVVPEPDKQYDENKSETCIVDDRPVVNGQDIAYKLTWSNHKASASTIVLTDKLSPGLEYNKDASPIAPDVGFPHKDAFGNTLLQWTLTDKPSGDFGYIDYTAKIDDKTLDLPNKVDNEYKIVIAGEEYGAYSLINPVVGKQYNADDTTEDVVKDDRTLVVGDVVAYRINWANNYNVAGAVTLTDTLSKGLEYIEGSCPDGDPEIVGNVLTWDIGMQDAKQTGFVTYRARVTEDALSDKVETTIAKNSYRLTVQPTDLPEYNVGPSTTENFVVPDPVKRYDENAQGCKTNSDPCYVGDVIAYSLVWSNTIDGEADIKLTDTLSKGLSYVVDSANVAPSNVYELADGTTQIVWILNNQAKGACGEITYKAQVNDKVDFAKGVDNSYKIKIGNLPEEQINGLHNDVLDRPAQTNDSLPLWIILISIFALALAVILFYVSRSRKTVYVGRHIK